MIRYLMLSGGVEQYLGAAAIEVCGAGGGVGDEVVAGLHR